MKMFHIIDDVQAVIRSGGTFYQVPVYRRDDKIYAKRGGGFVQLMSHRGTTAPKVSWDDLEDHPDIEWDGTRMTTPKWKGVAND